MSDKFWLYQGRHGEKLLFPYTRAGFDAARTMQDEINGYTLEEIIEEFGEYAVSGSYDTGSFSIDDGGQISTVEVVDV